MKSFQYSFSCDSKMILCTLYKTKFESYCSFHTTDSIQSSTALVLVITIGSPAGFCISPTISRRSLYTTEPIFVGRKESSSNSIQLGETAVIVFNRSCRFSKSVKSIGIDYWVPNFPSDKNLQILGDVSGDRHQNGLKYQKWYNEIGELSYF